jgi:hypothetical protein
MEFNFTTISLKKYFFVVFGLIALWILGVIIFALYVRCLICLIVYALGMPVFVLAKHTIFFRAESETVILNESGIGLPTKKTFIYWNELIWFFDGDGGKSWYGSSIRLKRKNGKGISIVYFRRNNNQEDWYRFKEYFFKMLKEKCPDIRNYYDSPVWNFYIYFLVGIIVILPVAFIILKVKMTAVIGPYMVALGTSLALIGQIISNRNKDRHIKSGSKKAIAKE